MTRRMAVPAGVLVVAAMAVVAGGQKPPVAGPPADRIARGEYLVTHVAMCVQCHSPRNDRGELDRERLLQGGPIPVKSPWARQEWAAQAPSLVGLPGGWSEEQLANFLQSGKDANRRPPRAPMPLYRLNRADAQAVAAYLQSLRTVGGVTTRPS